MLLFIDDLCRAMIKIVEKKQQDKFGVYNLSSLNSKIGIIAKKIAKIHNSKKQSFTQGKKIF